VRGTPRFDSWPLIIGGIFLLCSCFAPAAGSGGGGGFLPGLILGT
jgi:hypothetical protein